MNPILQPILFGGVNVVFRAEEPTVQLQYANAYKAFLNSSSPEITISVKLGKPQRVAFENPNFVTGNWAFYGRQNFSVIRIHTPGRPSHRSHYSILLDANGELGNLYFEDLPSHSTNDLSIIVPPFALDEILAVQLLGMRRGVMIHSCALRTINNQGLLFAGVSGEGKSTTAKLWVDSGKAILIGDERVSVRKRDGTYWLLSTAWHGSGQVSGSGAVPLHHLFILNHAETNQARLLKPSEAVSLLMARAYLPFWDRAGMEFTLKFLDDLCCSIPCYHLGFTLDQSAVDYVECLISS